jgi:hypothetical protein
MDKNDSFHGHLVYIFLAVRLIVGILVHIWQFSIPILAVWYIFGSLVYFWQLGIFLEVWYIFGSLVYLGSLGHFWKFGKPILGSLVYICGF